MRGMAEEELNGVSGLIGVSSLIGVPGLIGASSLTGVSGLLEVPVYWSFRFRESVYGRYFNFLYLNCFY